MTARAVLRWILLLTWGCADSPGHGFSTLESVAVSAELEPGAAREIDGAILTNKAYRVTVTRFELELGEASLLSLSAGSAPTAFDPANPPPGYSLCHGGHCHADSGELVDYADIEAELAGTSGGFSEVVTTELDATLDVLEDERIVVSEFEPSRELPEVELRKVKLFVKRVRIEADVVADDDVNQSFELSMNLPVLAELEEGMDIAVDRDGPKRLSFELMLHFDGSLFDDLEFAALSEEGRVEVTDAESAAGLSFLGAIAISEFSVTLI